MQPAGHETKELPWQSPAFILESVIQTYDMYYILCILFQSGDISNKIKQILLTLQKRFHKN